jgi:hypothetical protein
MAAAIPTVAVGSTSAVADIPVARVFVVGGPPHRGKWVVARLRVLADSLRARKAIPHSSGAARPARIARVA